MEDLFSLLSGAVEGTPLIAIAAAGAWGILSIVLSPCHLASIPLVIGYIARQPHRTARSALVISLLFALGIIVTIGVIAGITAASGGLLGDGGPVMTYLVAALFLTVGLHLIGAIDLPMPQIMHDAGARSSRTGALVLGLALGAALGPCTFAFMAPVIGAALRIAGPQPALAATLVLTFAAGHSLVIVLAGASTGRVERWLAWGTRTNGIAILRIVSGALVLLGGLYLIYIA